MDEEWRNRLEAILFAADRALSVRDLRDLLADEGGEPAPDPAAIESALRELQAAWTGRGVELAAVAGGWRVRVPERYAPWVARLWPGRTPRQSRALMETLALIVYRQPITRAEIEAVRGVTVSTSIMRTLLDRGWVRVVGQREVPGRPSLYGTTRTFLHDFSLRDLDELPSLESFVQAWGDDPQLALPEAELPNQDPETESSDG